MSDKTYNILIEGQTIPVPPEIGTDDAKVKASLAPFFPDAANAQITRAEKGEVVTITVTKKAGSKGAAGDNNLLAQLETTPGGMNPVMEMHARIAGQDTPLGVEELMALDTQIEMAITEGEKQAEAIQWALKRLQAAQPVAAPLVVMGF
jgi:hypothetical protein